MTRHHEELAEYNETMREVQELRAEIERLLRVNAELIAVLNSIERTANQAAHMVERLRACHGIQSGDPECNCLEAAAEIERLIAERDQWKAKWAVLAVLQKERAAPEPKPDQ